MSNFQIIDKDELTNVDRSADYILVYDFNAAKLVRSNVNSLLDLLSHPVGIDDSQILTNKTVTAPTISSPVLSGTITGTYTFAGTPTFPSSVVTLTSSQTLTNKVLTSPTINNPTISNPTITVDSIAEYTSANGVTIDGLNIKDSVITTANSVTNAALVGGITDSKLIYGKLRYRQGGSATDWNATGTTPYDYSAVNVFSQAGCAISTDNTTNSSNGWFATSSQTITFPVAFAQKPLVFVTSLSDHAICTVNSTTASGFSWKARANTSIAASSTMMWVAIGQ